ncbi:MAG: SDR family NAD(P)-dependent oxidoreductase, partial [Gammaproteobacteria bacterium]
MPPTHDASPHLVADKHVVVTGGARGIGRAIATLLHRQGARVMLMGRNESALAETAAALPGARWLSIDVTDSESVHAAFEAAKTSWGAVEILVNNAGAAASAPFAKTDRKLWDSMLAVNLTGMFEC